MSLASMTCPLHKTPLHVIHTRFGPLWACTTDGCDVRCWGGSTSTPADGETRVLRQEAHEALDSLIPERKKRYRWLRRVLSVPPDEAHIGMCDAEQCRMILEAVAEAAKENN